MDKNTATGITDQTIISRLRFSNELDFSLENLHVSGPSATSTAAPIKQREKYLLTYPDKENFFETTKPNCVSPRSDINDSILKDITQSNNNPDQFYDLKENITKDSHRKSTEENKFLLDGSRNSYRSRSSTDSNDSNLFPGSSILAQSGLVSFNSSEEEIDLLKDIIEEAPNLLGLPSYLIGSTSKEANKSAPSGVWDDDDDRVDPAERDTGNHMALLEHDLKCKTDLLSLPVIPFKSSIGNVNPFAGHQFGFDNSFQTAFDINLKANNRQSNSQDDFDGGEEFHSINYKDFFDAEEEEKKKDRNFLIESGVSFSDKSDLSGFINPRDVIIQPSMWNMGGDLKGNKLNVEDILAAKSEKLGSLKGNDDEMPSFGFGRSGIQSPQKYDILEESNPSSPLSSTRCSENPNDSQFSISSDLLVHDSSKPLNSIPAIKLNNESLIIEEKRFTQYEEKSILSSNFASSNIQQNVTQNEVTSTPMYMGLLRNIIEKASKTSDPKQLVEQMLRCANRDPTLDSDSLMDLSADVLEMRLYREFLMKDKVPDRSSQNQLDAREAVGQSIQNQAQAIELSRQSAQYQAYEKEIRDQAVETQNQFLKEFEQPTISRSQLRMLSNPSVQHQVNVREETEDINQYMPVKEEHEKLIQRRKIDKSTFGIPSSTVPQNKFLLEINDPVSSSTSEDAIPVRQSSSQPPDTSPFHHNEQILGNLPQVAAPAKPDIFLTKSCLTGIRTQVDLSVPNPTSLMMATVINKLDEGFENASDSRPVDQNFYMFEYARKRYLNPKSCINIPFSFCSLLPGMFWAHLEIKLYRVDSPNDIQSIGTKRVEVKFEIHKANVSIKCDNTACVDFGLVPEYCAAKKEIELHNHSTDPFPVLINLKSLSGFDEYLSWSTNQPQLKLLSTTLAACELPAQSTVKLMIHLKAPSMEVLKANGIVEVLSELEVILDLPQTTSLSLAKVPVKVRVGEVLLRTFRSKIPVTIEAVAGKFASSTLTLRNKSLFDLDLSIRAIGHEQLSVSPTRFSIPLQQDASFMINFTPTSDMGNVRIDGKLLILVEPEGLQMDLPVVAVSLLPELPPLQDDIELVQPTDSICPTETSKIEKVLISENVNLLTSVNRCVFGTVGVGDSNTQTVVLQNGWTEHVLSLQLTIKHSEAFYLGKEKDEEKLQSKEVKIRPKEKLKISITFVPSDVGYFKASLICICKDVTVPSRAEFPLHGLGGSGKLILKHGEDILSGENELCFGKVVPGTPLVLNIMASNPGERFIFVKMRVLADELSDQPMPIVDVCIQPCDFVLGPGEAREIIVITTGSPNIMRLAPGRVAYLQAIYGDEILRRRFRNSKSKEVKLRKLNDSRLLKINFDNYIHREKTASDEKTENYPLFPDDALTFFNKCKVFTIPLSCEVDEDADGSATMMDVEFDEETICSLAHNLTNREPGENINIQDVLKKTVSTPKSLKRNSEFEVFPPELKLTTSQKSPKEVSIVNYSEVEQVLEIVCETLWLNILPREVTVDPKSFMVIQVHPIAANIPRNTNKITKTSFQILGQNNEREVKVILEIDSPLMIDKSLQILKYSIQASTKMIESSKAKLLAESGSERAKRPTKLETPVEDCQRFQSPKNMKLEIGELTFPPTPISKERASKLLISNYDMCDYQIKLMVPCKHFHVRHTNIHLKAQRSVYVPVSFRPLDGGDLTEYITVIVNEQYTYKAKLNGKGLSSD